MERIKVTMKNEDGLAIFQFEWKKKDDDNVGVIIVVVPTFDVVLFSSCSQILGRERLVVVVVIATLG